MTAAAGRGDGPDPNPAPDPDPDDPRGAPGARPARPPRGAEGASAAPPPDGACDDRGPAGPDAASRQHDDAVGCGPSPDGLPGGLAAPAHPLLDGAVLWPSGEDAVVVEFGRAIDPVLQGRVLALTAALDAAPPPGLREVVPTYRSALILYDPDATDPRALLGALPDDAPAEARRGRRWRVPVCLEGAMAEDLDEAAALLDLAPEEVRERLLASDLRVAMYGFAPGLAYLGGLDPGLAVPRRASPRPPMPAGSVIVAGGQAALASVPMPTGWFVVGRAGVRMFDPLREPMVPFEVGDRLTLVAVPEDRLAELARCGGGVEEIA